MIDDTWDYKKKPLGWYEYVLHNGRLVTRGSIHPEPPNLLELNVDDLMQEWGTECLCGHKWLEHADTGGKCMQTVSSGGRIGAWTARCNCAKFRTQNDITEPMAGGTKC